MARGGKRNAEGRKANFAVKFSIITPSFDQLDWLRLAAASVKDQEGVEVEHIIQDGNVKAFDAETLAKELSQGEAEAGTGYERRIFVEKDAGMYDAINRGLRRSSGEICAWLNCDEQYLPGTLARVGRFFSAHPGIDVVFGDAILVDGSGRALSYRGAVLPDALHTRLVHLNTLSCATFFRRKMVEQGHLFDTKWRAIGDAVWVHGMIRAGVAMAVLNEALAIFAFTGVNQSASEKARREAAEWSGATDAPPGWLRKPAILRHRLAKWTGGAYRKRSFSYEIRSMGGRERNRHEANSLGWGWPEEEGNK